MYEESLCPTCPSSSAEFKTGSIAPKRTGCSREGKTYDGKDFEMLAQELKCDWDENIYPCEFPGYGSNKIFNSVNDAIKGYPVMNEYSYNNKIKNSKSITVWRPYKKQCEVITKGYFKPDNKCVFDPDENRCIMNSTCIKCKEDENGVKEEDKCTFKNNKYVNGDKIKVECSKQCSNIPKCEYKIKLKPDDDKSYVLSENWKIYGDEELNCISQNSNCTFKQANEACLYENKWGFNECEGLYKEGNKWFIFKSIDKKLSLSPSDIDLGDDDALDKFYILDKNCSHIQKEKVNGGWSDWSEECYNSKGIVIDCIDKKTKEELEKKLSNKDITLSEEERKSIKEEIDTLEGYKVRKCNNPKPANGGNDCSNEDGGNSKKKCNEKDLDICKVNCEIEWNDLDNECSDECGNEEKEIILRKGTLKEAKYGGKCLIGFEYEDIGEKWCSDSNNKEGWQHENFIKQIFTNDKKKCEEECNKIENCIGFNLIPGNKFVRNGTPYCFFYNNNYKQDVTKCLPKNKWNKNKLFYLKKQKEFIEKRFVLKQKNVI